MNQTFPSRGVLKVRALFSRWDLLALPLIFGALLLLTHSFEAAHAPFKPGTPDLTVSLDPRNLPYYALRSAVRMLLAVLFSLLFTFTYATLAARSRRAERILIPILDFLQSLPILGFLTVTTTLFLGLFRGSVMGLEAASIFAIFTSQAWNMAFSFYASLTSIPKELDEVSRQLGLSAWQRFWKLDVPYATPSLLWNTMMSVSGGWFFVVASEMISVSGRQKAQELPGLGAYIGEATARADLHAMAWAGLALLVTIVLYDQLLFRPIMAWAEKFKFEQSKSEVVPSSWMLTLWQRARFTRSLMVLPARGWEALSRLSVRRVRPAAVAPARPRLPQRTADLLWTGVTTLLSLGLLGLLLHFIFGAGLGVQAGHLLGANPELNPDVSASTAQAFAQAGVTVQPDHSVWLSDVCHAPQTAALQGLVAQSDPQLNLASACVGPLVEAGRVSLTELPHLFLLGSFTLLRVVGMVALATLIWLPIGVWIGLSPRLATRVQPLVQFLAAFPANLVFPVAVILITRLHLAPWVLLTPLLVLGTQWYILFNVIAGALALPADLKEAARVQGLRGPLLWKRLLLPAVFPAAVTGGVTASGGSWNASIVSEVVTWGTATYSLAGLGAYIARWSTGTFNPHVAIGMVLMGLFVLGFNRLLWHRLYELAETRYRIG